MLLADIRRTVIDLAVPFEAKSFESAKAWVGRLNKFAGLLDKQVNQSDKPVGHFA